MHLDVVDVAGRVISRAAAEGHLHMSAAVIPGCWVGLLVLAWALALWLRAGVRGGSLPARYVENATAPLARAWQAHGCQDGGRWRRVEQEGRRGLLQAWDDLRAAEGAHRSLLAPLPPALARVPRRAGGAAEVAESLLVECCNVGTPAAGPWDRDAVSEARDAALVLGALSGGSGEIALGDGWERVTWLPPLAETVGRIARCAHLRPVLRGAVLEMSVQRLPPLPAEVGAGPTESKAGRGSAWEPPFDAVALGGIVVVCAPGSLPLMQGPCGGLRICIRDLPLRRLTRALIEGHWAVRDTPRPAADLDLLLAATAASRSGASLWFAAGGVSVVVPLEEGPR